MKPLFRAIVYSGSQVRKLVNRESGPAVRRKEGSEEKRDGREKEIQ